MRLQSEGLDPGALLGDFCLGRSDTGAVVSFTGLVRGESDGVDALELDAYPGLTEVEIERMTQAARTRFDLQDVLVVHRVGRMAAGEAIVFVATASRHRRAAFEAADHLMDYLKSRAPLWKKSHGADGSRWIEPTQRDHDDAARWDVAEGVAE